jgi:hypothetical protein
LPNQLLDERQAKVDDRIGGVAHERNAVWGFHRPDSNHASQISTFHKESALKNFQARASEPEPKIGAVLRRWQSKLSVTLRCNKVPWSLYNYLGYYIYGVAFDFLLVRGLIA